MYKIYRPITATPFARSESYMEWEPLLFEVVSMEERVQRAEQFLLRDLHTERANPIVMDAVWQILRRRGNLSVGQLSGEVHASNRTLERLYLKGMQ